jgi:2-oxo-3-hexenedioate decarboxylase
VATTQLAEIADRIATAQRTGQAIDQFGDELTLDAAYAVQRLLLDRRLNEGACYIGPKLGFTSRAKMAQMGVDEIIVGWLVDDMELPSGGTVDLSGTVHPRVEPELVFRLGRAVGAEVDEDDLLDAVEAVAPAIEIIDSRYRDFRFSLPDVVADNTSACRFVLGEWRTMDGQVELNHLPVTMYVDDSPVQTGSTADILGNPLTALRELAPIARRHAFPLPAGAIILAGGATAAAPLAGAESVRAEISGMGQVAFHVTQGSDG